MSLVIVTGMSGAGKSSALKFLEDMDFFCIDNLPACLISKFAKIYLQGEIKQSALGIDIRGREPIKDLLINLKKIKKINYKILFLDASDEILVKRFKETRRVHPLARRERIIAGIKRERNIMSDVKNKADYIIDTSHMRTNELKEKISDIFITKKNFPGLIINIISFGFKYGLPQDSDLVFDVRFIPNPFYIMDLRNKTGEDIEVKNYVLKYKLTKLFLDKILDLICFLIPHYIQEGKNQLIISIGCTGGRHRSVVLSTEIYNKLTELNYYVSLSHRDIKNANITNN
jgi:UPF0042 nucleotide-binding protein